MIRDRRRKRIWLHPVLLGVALLCSFAVVSNAQEEQSQQAQARVIALARGASELLRFSEPLSRVAVVDSSIANPVAISPSEILVNGRAIGRTTLMVWDAGGNAQAYTVEVTFDAAALNRVFATIFPGEAIEAIASGNMVVLKGTASGSAVAQRMVEIARGTGATIIEHFTCVRPSSSC